jgi:hypothetical protein
MLKLFSITINFYFVLFISVTSSVGGGSEQTGSQVQFHYVIGSTEKKCSAVGERTSSGDFLAIKEKQLEPVVKALRTEQRRSPKFDDISKVRESKVNSVER